MNGLHETLGRVRSSLEGVTDGAPATETVGLMRELANRLEAFSLFECPEEILGLAPGGRFQLSALLAAADAQGPYRAMFLKEGIGYVYAASALNASNLPRELLDGSGAAHLPRDAEPSIHVGAAMRFAEHALREAHAAPAERVTNRFVALWIANVREEWRAAGVEPLGFATHVLRPELVPSMGAAAERLGRRTAGYYWHGVGRALYFSLAMAMPLCGAHARALWLAKSIAPSPEACRNLVAGWAWGMTLTNVRHPALIEAALVHACEAAPPVDALFDGMAGALTLVNAAVPRDPFRQALQGHQPRSRHARRLWNRIALRACAASSRGRPVADAFRYNGG